MKMLDDRIKKSANRFRYTNKACPLNYKNYSFNTFLDLNLRAVHVFQVLDAEMIQWQFCYKPINISKPVTPILPFIGVPYPTVPHDSFTLIYRE